MVNDAPGNLLTREPFLLDSVMIPCRTFASCLVLKDWACLMLVLYEDVKHCRRTGAVHQSKLSLALQLEAQVMNLPVGFETAEP